MCPLRLILIFLSATLAGFFVLRNLNSQPHVPEEGRSADSATPTSGSESSKPAASVVTRSSKVLGAIEAVFWTFVDMASGRYLWRNLVSSASSSSSSYSSPSSKCTN